MNVSVRSYLSSGVAAATATVIVVAPMEAQTPARPEAPPVALAAQVQPPQLPALIAQQVSFNTGVAVDFVVTGAQLLGRQIQVGQALIDDVGNGTPIPVAVGRAIAGFTNIELDAGRELVGFGRELAEFQIQFFGNLVSQQLPALLAQQVSFNTGVAVDFVVTGAQLLGRQLQVAEALVDDLGNGTPIPVAAGRAVAGFTNIELDAGRELVGFGRELVDFQIEFFGNLVSQRPPAVAAPAEQTRAVSAGTVDAVDDVANGAIARLAQVVNIPVAQSQSRQTSRTGASPRMDNVVTLSREKPKATAVDRDSTRTAMSSAKDTVRRVAHALRDGVRRNGSPSASDTADSPNASSRHQQSHSDVSRKLRQLLVPTRPSCARVRWPMRP